MLVQLNQHYLSGCSNALPSENFSPGVSSAIGSPNFCRTFPQFVKDTISLGSSEPNESKGRARDVVAFHKLTIYPVQVNCILGIYSAILLRIDLVKPNVTLGSSEPEVCSFEHTPEFEGTVEFN
jgi:hypothetical protein